MSLGEFAIANVPGKDELGPLLDRTYEAVDRLFRVYARLAARLAYLAELVENALGLPPYQNHLNHITNPTISSTFNIFTHFVNGMFWVNFDFCLVPQNGTAIAPVRYGAKYLEAGAGFS